MRAEGREVFGSVGEWRCGRVHQRGEALGGVHPGDGDATDADGAVGEGVERGVAERARHERRIHRLHDVHVGIRIVGILPPRPQLAHDHPAVPAQGGEYLPRVEGRVLVHGHGGRARRGSVAPEPRFRRDARLELVVARDLSHAAGRHDASVWERRGNGRRGGRRVSPVHLEAFEQRVPLRVRALDPGLGREVGLRRLGRGGEAHGCAVEQERASAADAAHRRGRLRRLGHLEEPLPRDEPPRLLGVVVVAKVQRDEVARAHVVEGRRGAGDEASASGAARG